ncbi:Conidiation protein 6-domain-containing protein [Abortiporus biennis]|nr:Conidiation protein 6-domain-containing protein [Abortiporus biennis]
MTSPKDPSRVAAGLKATIHNPNVSSEAKERAEQKLGEMGETQPTTGSTRRMSTSSDHDNRVLGGYKATLTSERTSEQAKAHAREVLEAAGYHVEREAGVSETEHQNRVISGYKAALHNPRVSAEAKEHAKQYLKEHKAL